MSVNRSAPGPFSENTTLDWADRLEPTIVSSLAPSAEQLAGLKLSTKGSSCPERWAERNKSVGRGFCELFVRSINIKTKKRKNLR